jgi:hypothetical protein
MQTINAHPVDRIRKVKCDEGRPSCHRCVSTGRVCDGYGIWGGGGKSYHQQSLLFTSRSVTPLSTSISCILEDGTDENQYFEWFRCRAAKKIPGAFILSFWDKLVHQASLYEPAVLHAILSLSSMHKRDSFQKSGHGRRAEGLDKYEKFSLQQYTKAIRNLQPHLSNKDRGSVRVALITCVVFICLEFLSGHFKTAQAHLQSGMKLLEALHRTSPVDNEIVSLSARDHIDDTIIKAFSRLRIQVELFKYNHQHEPFMINNGGPDHTVHLFSSINEAWQQIEQLLNTVFTMEYRIRQQRRFEQLSGDSSVLFNHQENIQVKLLQWLDVYEASKNDLESETSEGMRCPLLCEYHTMASIMASTCLREDDENLFDDYTDQFISIIEQSVKMWTITSSNMRVIPSWYDTKMSHSIVDIGWIPPLFYTAIKCRVHRVRLQAIKLLESASHREGIWDSKITACVARQVMKIEERDFYDNVNTSDDFLLSSLPTPWDLSLPTIPQSYRIREVEVDLPDSPADEVFLFYQQQQTSGEWKGLRRSIEMR